MFNQLQSACCHLVFVLYLSYSVAPFVPKRYETVNIFVVYRYLQSWTGFPNPGIHDWGFYNGPHSIIAYIIASVL